MNYNNKKNLRNIIANMFLVIAMSLSLIGGAFLLAPQRNARAAEVVTGKPEDIKFASQVVTASVTGYDNENGFRYENSNFNYVNVKNVVYYVHDGKLYTDSSHAMQSKDLSVGSVTSTTVSTVKKQDSSDSGVDFGIYSDRFSVEYNGIRYFLKNGVLYEDLACTKTSSLLYEVVYKVNGTATLPTRVTIQGDAYYQVSGADRYIKVNRSNNDEYTLSGGVASAGSTITPQHIYIFNTESENAIMESANRYVQFGETKYYLYNNKLYNSPAFSILSDTALDDLCGNKTGQVYSGGYVFRSNGYVEVLYKISTEETTATLSGMTVNFIKVENLNSNVNYYLNVPTKTIEKDNNGTIETETVLDFSQYDNKIYSISSGVATAVDTSTLGFSVMGTTTMNEDTYLITRFNYGNNTDYSTKFIFNSTTYYIINSQVCTQNTLDATTTTNGFYTASNKSRTFSVDINQSYVVTAGGIYYPIDIWGNTYYVTSTNPTQLYTIATTTDKNNEATPVTTITNCDSFTVSQSNNLINVTIYYTAKYLMNSNNLYEVNPISLSGRDSFICYSDTYYYNNNGLYLDTEHKREVADFKYTCNIDSVLIGNVYHELQQASFQYVVIDGKTFYVNNGTLYANLYLCKDPNSDGSESVIEFKESDMVHNEILAYKVNSSKKLVTIFNGLTNGQTISATNTVQYGDIEYTLDGNDLKYTKNEKTLTFYDLNIDYTIYINDTPKSMTLQPVKADFSDYPATDSASLYAFNQTVIVANTYGLTSKAKINGFDVFLYFNKDDVSDSNNGLYYYTAGADMYATGADLTLANNVKLQAGEWTIKNYDGSSKIKYMGNKAFTDYILMDNNNDTAYDTVYFEEALYTTASTFNFEYAGTIHEITISGTSLLLGGIDLSFKFMEYTYDSSLELIKVNRKFNVTTSKFDSYNSYSSYEDFEYIYDISNDSYYISLNTNNKLTLYADASLSATHIYSPGTELTADYKANEIHLEFHNVLDYFDVQSDTGKSYKEFATLTLSNNTSNGEVALLNNYLPKTTLIGGDTADVNTFYIAFNEKKRASAEAETPVVTSGAHQLTVQAYLNNDFVMKYKGITSSYYVDSATGKAYGILLDINPIVEEQVTYSNLVDNINVNHYWYDYFDLTNVKARIKYDYLEDSNNYITEKIEDASGLYTFVFNFTYINNGKSTQYVYTYSVYITESSKYIEFPTFNTQITTAIDTSTKDQYYEVVRIDPDLSESKYYYNNQTYDLPIYTYDASKYNVSFDVKYNISQNFYTTDFILVNAGRSDEYGILSVYKNGTLNDTYTITLDTLTDNNSNKYRIAYYTKNGKKFGALCVNSNGQYLLSLDDFYYYNPQNYVYDDIGSLTAGRIIKNGPQNSPSSYYFPMIMEELGDYTIHTKYIVSEGSSDITNQSTFRVFGKYAENTFYGSYSEIDPNGAGGKIYNSEVLRYGKYDDTKNGEFVFLSGYSGLADNDETDLKKPEYTTLHYFGIQTKFIKDDVEVPFSQISKNIYSDITPNTSLKSSLDNLIIKGQTGEKPLDCNIPITNLQPIYFDYFGNFNYSESKYYRISNATYNVGSDGNLTSIDCKDGVIDMTTIGFNNKTTISAPGLYIVKVNYGPNGEANTEYTQYFAFVIENSAPNLTIYTYDGVNDDELFISSTSFNTTTRYTNAEYLKAVWPIPNYFQGAISLSYTRTSYDGNTVLNQVDNYVNGNYIPTAEGRYTFTIRYGIRQASYTSTYVIVDHTTPTGQMYSTESVNDGTYLTNSSRAIKNIFNGPSVFASTPKETATSGAKVYARISAISFSNFNNSGEYDIYNKIIANESKNSIEAIKTNVQLNANNSLLGAISTLDDAPRYNFFDIAEIGSDDTNVSPTQILGNSDQSLIYIIKLYDEAGNYGIYYYIFDKSSPYMAYQILPSSQDDILKDITENMENNTTQTNTNIIWGNYKAIRISNADDSYELFLGFKNAINEAYSLRNKNYGGMFFKEVTETIKDESGKSTTETNLYLYVPINSTDIQSTINIDKVNQDVIATTQLPSLTNKATIFVSKTDDVTALNDKITSYNKPGNYNISIGNITEPDRPALASSYYSDFFKGDKNYTFYVTDAFGNTTTQILTLNSSVAQETFYLNSTARGYSLINPTKQRAYNAEQLNVYYKDLEKEEQAFAAKITYDHFAIDFEHFLTTSNINEDTLKTYYYEYCYDVETGVVYRYDITGEDGKNFKQCVFNTETKQYDYAPGAEFISFSEVPNAAFFPGYPYTISSTNMAISTSTKADDDKYLASAIINSEDGLTKQGLYVFRRSYINITDNKEISQDAIDSQTDENLAILKDDYAVRYHVFYIDRNKIIDLSYDLLGEIDEINSIGNLLEIYLGRDLNGKQEALITAETFSNYSIDKEIDTNKLKVQTNFTKDKYSTIEKLESNRRYQYRKSIESGQSKTFNEIMEDISITTNKIIFNYNIDLQINGRGAVVSNNVTNSSLAQSVTTTIESSAGNQTKTSYAANVTGRYVLTISDSSSMSTVTNSGYDQSIVPSTLNFQFNVIHNAPSGTYITKENDDFGSLKQLTIRSDPSANASGHTTTFTSSNVENLSFTFTDSNNPYLASVNPYQIKVFKESSSGNRTTLLSTKFNTNNDGSYIDTFSTDVIANMARLSDVLIISGDSAPYTYTINIFDRNSPVSLLSNWAEDTTYIVQINYIGNNPDDYTVAGMNYYYSMFRIHIDRQAPQNNLKQLVQNDPNINDYCRDKYGKTYYELANSSDASVKQLYKELMTSYAFPVRMIENENLLHYYKKEHPNTTITSTDTLLGSNYIDQVNSLYETYATIYNHDFDDSVKIYTRIVGDTASDYKYSILPSESEYAEGINGHLKFTESADEFYQHNYVNQSIFNFSTTLKAGETENTDENKFFQTNYYEIIEADEAGNLTRYFVYISDGTTVEVDFNYINSDNDTCNTYIDNNNKLIETFNDPLPFYIDYEGTRYYLSNHEGEWKLYEKGNMYEHTTYNTTVVKLNSTSLSEAINWSYYFHNNTYESMPTSIIINDTEFIVHKNSEDADNLIYGRHIINSESTDQYINALSLTGIHYIKEYVTESPVANEKYTFDDFYSVKIYQVSGGTERLIMDPILSDPYIENGSGHNFMNNIVNRFKAFVSSNKNIYTYKFEICNRYTKTPFVMYINLPDADLDLGFTTAENGNLVVSIPDSSIYNVKITSFSVFYYQDYAWRPLSQDANKKIIQTSNTIDASAGLPATSYELAPGQYKFFFMDNFQRKKTVYQIVGGTADSRPPEFSFAKPYIQDDLNYTTSGNAVLLVDDNVWNVQVVLRNAVQVNYGTPTDPTYVYYALKSFGNSTILCNNDNQGGDYKPVYLKDKNAISLSGSSFIYYYMGKLFANEECTEQISLTNYSVRVNTPTRLIYTLGNPVGTRKSYILNPFSKFSGFSVDEFEIITNWITDEANSEAYTTYKLNIDQTQPKLILMTDSGLLEAVNGQNYNKPFTITWQSDYKIVSARIIQHLNGRRNEIVLDPNGSYDVHTFAGYTLYLTDEIGNELMSGGTKGFSFNFVEIANEYFSVYVDGIYILPSDYISTNSTDGKTIRYYYYQDKLNHDEEILIETDQTKNIVCEGSTDVDGKGQVGYIIKRNNIDYVICYLRLIPVDETSDIANFISNITFNYSEESQIESQVIQIKNINNYTFTESQDCESFQLSVYKNLYSTTADKYIDYIGNRVYVDYYYNNTFVKTYSPDSWATIKSQSGGKTTLENALQTINCSSTGVHRFEFFDAVNNRAVNAIQVTLIKDVMFSANGENPMDNRIYNGDVVVDIPETIYYQNVTVTATLNGKEITEINALKTGTKYTFTASGIYVVNMVAQNETTAQIYTSTYKFTIINPNVARMTFGFGNDCGFTISKVIKNNADITDKIRAESIDSMWLTSGKPDTVGSYTITLIGFDKLTNEYTPFTFKVRLNNEIPSINAVNFQFGTKTSNPVTIQYNPALIYSQVGESYIYITNNEGTDHTININSESPDGLLSFVINIEGKFNITIYDKDGNFITNYTFTKVAPLNSSAKFVIIVVSILAIALVVIFIVLRRHTKFR